VEASSLARELGVSAPTVSNYLTVLDQTYVNFLLPSYQTNLANELKKSKKTYLYDLGIRNSILRDFRPADEREDRGAIHETQVFLTLVPSSGLLAFCRRYPKVRHTFTVSARAFPPVEDGDRTHHFLGFEEVPTILDAMSGIGPGSR